MSGKSFLRLLPALWLRTKAFLATKVYHLPNKRSTNVPQTFHKRSNVFVCILLVPKNDRTKTFQQNRCTTVGD